MIETKKKTINQKKNLTAFDLMPSDENAIQIMRSRSKSLAKSTREKKEAGNKLGFICFYLGKNDRYGIFYYAAREVLAQPFVTKLPNTPDYMSGIVNWRGNLVTVVDLKKFFKLSASENAENSIIITESQHVTVGLLVGKLVGSDVCNSNNLEPPLSTGAGIPAEYITGLHQGSIALLNIETILAGIKS